MAASVSPAAVGHWVGERSGDADLVPNEFVGVRTGGFSRGAPHLMVRAAVPVGPVEDRDEVLWALLTEAVEVAEAYAKRQKIAEALPELARCSRPG